jgi:hypothetical protein
MYLIIFAGLLLAHGLSFGLMFYERYESATSVMLNTLENEVSTSVAILDRLPAAERPQWLSRLQRDNYRFVLGTGQAGTPLVSGRARDVTAMIAKQVGTSYGVHGDTISTQPERYQVHLTLRDGSLLTLELTPRGVMPVAEWLPFVLILQVALLLACGWFAVREASQPLARLASAADAMTPAGGGPRMAEGGPNEVAHAAMAFNATQDRISRYLKERLHILASISHDLQTPITRMRLRAESLDDGMERDRILADLGEMEHLVREGVAYARSAHGGDEAPARIDTAGRRQPEPRQSRRRRPGRDGGSAVVACFAAAGMTLVKKSPGLGPGLRTLSRYRCLYPRPATQAAEQQRKNEQDQEDHEKDLRDAGGTGGNAGEAEDRGDKRDHEKDDGPMQHDVLLWRVGGWFQYFRSC